MLRRRSQLPRTRPVALAAALLFCLLFAVAAHGQGDDSPDIVGGQEATPGEFPWQVALVYKGSDLYNNQFCGGTLIAADWVVTAAHCIDDKTTAVFDVVAGIHNLYSPDPNYERRTIAQIIPHPYWDSPTYDNDIALLKLTWPIAERNGSGTTLPIKYGKLVPSNVGNLAGKNVTVTGWGNRAATPPGGVNYPAKLHKVTIPVATNAACASAYAAWGPITANMLCAGSAGKDSCQGDSGGPAVYKNGSTWQLAGVVSWGVGCANPAVNNLGVYARVAQYTTWINGYVSPLPPGAHKTMLPVVYSPVYPLLNGHFENGPNAGWTQSSTHGYQLILDSTALIVPPHGGAWAAWLGGEYNETSLISQVVTIPPAQPVLAFYHWVGSNDSCGYDKARVMIDNILLLPADLCQAYNTGGWVRVSLNLSAYAGQTVKLKFEVITDGSLNSNWFIDDVSFVSMMAGDEPAAFERTTPAPPPGVESRPKAGE